MNLFVALAPIANMSHSTSMLKYSKWMTIIWDAVKLAGIHEIFSEGWKQ